MTRLGILNVALRTVGRPILSRTKTPQAARRDFAFASRVLFRRPPGMAMASYSVPGPAGPICVAQITAGPVREDGAILYFHGGGYVAGSAATHSRMLARLARLSRTAVHAPDYRLAPEALFPAAYDDARAAWEGVLAETGLAPDRIVLAGDSAGGGLALALLADLLARGLRPAGLFAFSPWTDLTLQSPSLEENAGRDAILPRTRVEELVGILLGGADPADPRISPLHATWRDPPPVYLQASRTEILRDDSTRMEAALRAAGGTATVELWPDAPHVWQLFDGWVPEARAALEKAAAFVDARLTPRSEAGS